MTYEKLLTRQRRAVSFVRNVKQDEEWATKLEDEATADYAARKRITITNPKETREGITMAEMTKTEMKEYIDELEGKLDAIGELLGDSEDDSEDSEEDDEDGDEEDQPSQSFADIS